MATPHESEWFPTAACRRISAAFVAWVSLAAALLLTGGCGPKSQANGVTFLEGGREAPAGRSADGAVVWSGGEPITIETAPSDAAMPGAFETLPADILRSTNADRPWRPRPVSDSTPPSLERVLTHWPAAANRSEYVVLSAAHGGNDAAGAGATDRLSLSVQRFDWISGEAVGPSRPLYDYPASENQRGSLPPLPPRAAAALGNGGESFAVERLDAGGVAVFGRDGNHVRDLAVSRPDSMMWLDATTLAVADAAGVSCWRLERPDAIWQRPLAVRGSLQAAGSGWLAVAAADGVHVLEAETGADLIHLAVRIGGPAQLALSPDGTRLAVALAGRQARGSRQRLVVWNLTEGTVRRATLDFDALPQPRAGLRPCSLFWLGGDLLGVVDPTHVILRPFGRIDSRVQVFDFVAGRRRGALVLPMSRFRPEIDSDVLFTDPLGRAYIRHASAKPRVMATVQPRRVEHFFPAVLFDPALPAHQALVAAEADLPPVRVEVVVNAAKQGRRLADAVARTLWQKGFRIGPGGWTLQGRAGVKDSGGSLRTGTDKRIPIPKLVLDWRLLDPQGKADPTHTITEPWQRWDPSRSRYRTASEKILLRPGEWATSHTFDFPNTPREDIVAELTRNSEPLPSTWPGWDIIRSKLGGDSSRARHAPIARPDARLLERPLPRP